jgi:methanogenic corrinoid protein MtbC1
MGKLKMAEKKENFYKRKCYPGDESRILVSDKFIKKNKLKINIEIAEKIMAEDSLMGFEHEIALDFLPFKSLKKYLNDEWIKKYEEGEQVSPCVSDIKEAVQDFLDYMVFAWMKARNERGISAYRSLVKLATWMRILGRPDIAGILSAGDYIDYGKEELKTACIKLDIPYPDYL